MAVLTYPASVMAKSDLKGKIVIFYLTQKSMYGHNYSYTNEQVLHFVNGSVLFSLSDVCIENDDPVELC